MGDRPVDLDEANTRGGRLEREVHKALREADLRTAQAAGLGKQGLRRMLVAGFDVLVVPGFRLEILAGLADPPRVDMSAFDAVRVQEFGAQERYLVPARGCPSCRPGWVATAGIDASEVLRSGGRDPAQEFRGLSLLPSPDSSHLVVWEPQLESRTWFGTDQAETRLLVSPREVVREFMLRLIALWRRIDPARFARALARQLRVSRLWAHFRPARAPGRLTVASGHVTRGPDVSRMTEVLVVRGEPLALA